MLLHDIIFLCMGLALIVLGGTTVTDGAVAIAQRLKVTPLMIGLTVVAFGSSMPDLVVCFISTVKNHSQLAIGDVVGSGIFDLLLVVGVVALISPVSFDTQMRRFDIPMLFLSSLVLFLMADDKVVDGDPRSAIDRTDGLMLLLVFGFYMWYLIRNARATDTPAPAGGMNGAGATADTGTKPMRAWLAVGYVAFGLAALVFGGNWMVDGASGIARKCGMSEAMVGLTIVGIGSGIPDLASSVIAAVKKQPGLAIGNVVGACIFNVFFIMGFCGTVKPLATGDITTMDFLVLLGASALLLALGTLWKKHAVNRRQGALLALLYCGYIVYLALNIKP